jgi:DedD protein
VSTTWAATFQDMAESQDVETLKRRGRRRLVGAIALVLAAVIVLPMVFDTEPKRAPPVSVRIPSEDDPAFTPKVVPKAAVPSPAPEAKAPVPKPSLPEEPAAKAELKPEAAAEAKAEPKVEAKPKVVPAPAPSDAERKRAEAALTGKESFVVQVGAFATPEKIKEVSDKLTSAKLPFYSELVPIATGTATRFRAGPFATREAAAEAQKKLQALGFKPDKVMTRP